MQIVRGGGKGIRHHTQLLEKKRKKLSMGYLA